MAHIKLENGQIIFLSDENDRQEPIRITENDFQILLTFIFNNNRQGEIVIFHQDEESILPERENVDNFFEFSQQDSDYQQALSIINRLKEQNKFEKPRFSLRMDQLEGQLPLKLKVNPYLTFAGWDSNSLGNLTEKEAALLTALARKATYLYEVFSSG